MTLVITALASVVLTWGLGTVSSTRVALDNAVQARIDRVQQSLTIEDVQMVSATPPGLIRIWIRNSGSINIVVDQIYINNLRTPISAVCSPPNAAPPCSTSLTKLSLPIQAVGAVEVTGPPSITALQRTATGGGTVPCSTCTLSDTTQSWTTNQWATYLVTITSGPGSSPQESGTITTNSATVLTVTPTGGNWATAPTSSSQYTIACPANTVCPGTTYNVMAATTLGTTSAGGFTV